jgi:hypothetical protein
MPCKSREALQKRLTNESLQYDRAVRALAASHTGSGEPQRSDLADQVNAARLAAENARVALEAHCEERGC